MEMKASFRGNMHSADTAKQYLLDEVKYGITCISLGACWKREGQAIQGQGLGGRPGGRGGERRCGQTMGAGRGSHSSGVVCFMQTPYWKRSATATPLLECISVQFC